MSITAFDFQPRTRVVFGSGSLLRLGELAAEFRPSCVLVVSDPGIMDAGHYDRATDSLRSAGLSVQSFHDFSENPTSQMVAAGVRKAAEVKPDLLVGLGGGSSMDCCKGINFVYSCGGTIHDYHGVGKATCDLLPMIAIPTTSGTGSEAQSFALISDSETHVKMACGDPRAACRVAILDPELTLTQPNTVTSLTGIDAISHALETQVTLRRNPISATYSQRAFGLLARNFSSVLASGTDLDARSNMQLGALFSGMAIENSMLGGAHATANPITARHGIAHGQAVGLMLPPILRLNGAALLSQGKGRLYAELAREVDPAITESDAPERLAQWVQAWLKEAGLAQRLSDLDISRAQIPPMVEDALQQWTGTFNPVPLDAALVSELYDQVR